MNRKEILSLLRQITFDIVSDINEDDITENCYLRDIVIDSIERSDILIELCASLDVRIQMVKFSDKNIGEILDILEDKIKSK